MFDIYDVCSKGLTLETSAVSIVQWSVEEENTKMSKVAKGKGKTHGKNGKTGKFATEQTMNRQTAFKITIRGDC